MRIRATCEDYRAGRTSISPRRGDAPPARPSPVPLLAIWGTAGIAAETEDPLTTWANEGAHVAALSRLRHYRAEGALRSDRKGAAGFFTTG